MPSTSSADRPDFEAVFDVMPGINLLLAPDSPRFTMLAASDERLAATLTTREETLGRGLFEIFSDANPENDQRTGEANLRASLEIVLRTRAPHRMAVQRYDIRRPDDTWEVRHWAPVNVPVLGHDGAVRYIVHHVEDVTDTVRRVAAHEQLRGEFAESEDARREAERLRTEADAAARRLAFLADASERLAASLDYETTLREVLALAVPTIADWALYTVDGGDGTVRIVASRHAEPEKEAFIAETARRYPISVDEPAGAARALRTGEPELIPEVPDDLLEAVARDAEHLKLLRAVGFRSLMTVPVSVQGRTLGALGFVTGPSRRPYGAADLAFAQELARRAATAIDHARLYAEADDARHEADVERARAAESERQFRTLADAIPTLAWTARPDGFLDWYNARWYEYTGTTPEQMQGWGWQTVHDPASLPDIIARWQSSLATGAPFDMILPLRGADGQFRRFLTRAIPVRDAAGHVLRWFGTNADVESERAAREDAERAAARTAVLQALTDALSGTLTREDVAVVVRDHVASAFGAHLGVLALVTPDAKHLAVSAAQQLRRESWQEWRTFPLDAPVPLAEAARDARTVVLASFDAIAAHAPSIAELCREYGTEGMCVVPVIATGGQVLGAIGLSFARARELDVETLTLLETLARQSAQALERAQLFEAAQSARAEAEAANRAKSDFLAVMSHELRTPLNAIGGYTELIELGIHGPVTEAQRTALERIQRSQRHLLGLISGVLDYSRVEAGAVTYHLVAVPVTEAVAEAELLVAPQLREKRLGYSWSGAPPELSVRADREKLQQILLNLLGNAVKFTYARDGVPGRIEVACTVEEAASHVQIHVRDTGEGIAPGALERVFEPFVQADQRLTRPHAGVGLGLAISRDLARGMGGDLTAESTPGEGSSFTLTLPRA